jgi:hypothetical protein
LLLTSAISRRLASDALHSLPFQRNSFHLKDKFDQTSQIDMLHPEQRRIYQNMTAEQKLRIAADLYYSAGEPKALGLRAERPSWSEKKIQEEVRKILLYART